MAQLSADPAMGFSRVGYLAGVQHRREGITAEIDTIALEESGARDALAQAFESQKKFEHVAELAKLARIKEADRRETAELDEMARQAGRR